MSTVTIPNVEGNLELNLRRWTLGLSWVSTPIAYRLNLEVPIVRLSVQWWSKAARVEMDRTLAGRKSQPHGLPGRMRARVPVGRNG